MKITVTTDDLLTVDQAAIRLGRPRSTIYRWVAAKKLGSIKLGGTLFVLKDAVEREND